MVNIENITRQEEARKLKVERIKGLLSEFFENISVDISSTSISVRKARQIPSFLYIDFSFDNLVLFIPEKDIPKYTDKTIAFAEAYEKKFGVKVTLKTDYSKST